MIHQIKKAQWEAWPIVLPLRRLENGFYRTIRRDRLTGNLWEWVSSDKECVEIKKVFGGAAPNNQQQET